VAADDDGPPEDISPPGDGNTMPSAPPSCPYLDQVSDPVLPPTTVLPPVEQADDPSQHVSAPADAPPPSYQDIFKT
jgi:hypothetical protein